MKTELCEDCLALMASQQRKSHLQNGMETQRQSQNIEKRFTENVVGINF